MQKKNETKQIYIVCDGVGIYITPKYSVEAILEFVTAKRILRSDSFIEIDEGFYVDPSKISLIKEVTTDIEDEVITINS
ncbi:TPA: hypothetical protein I9092_002928 [Clostridium perfringens]|nr:hypothetical protein [Clostridium perfringens]EHK2389514.1 hypothetical protein [Clostridium perfringens]EHP45066.1 hypothetical protein HMPREF9476_03133 [Clostridium perfringens WAL-14572]EJT6560009.1 hypothetical protein [Clostridium perfringens]MBO3408142.1 hypothetical protein [Clostridium perfringens]MDM0716509.1 hypothetical protein [Clostridium perfringens]